MRSARVAIFAASVLLILLPLLLLGIAWGYERWLVQRYQRSLAEVAQAFERDPRADLTELGRREGAALRRLDGAGRPVAESETWGLAVTDSPVGGALEALLGRLGAASARERLQVADAAFGSLGERAEVRQALEGRGAFAMRDSPSGQTVLFSHAAPVAGGGVLYVTKASHRGIRQLLLVREQLVKLLVIQSAFALLIALLLTRWLVRPLERLADGARRYPGGALADPPLLSRPDEIGLLARSITSLAQSLEERRKATVDLAADMAHELKNPLATIAAASELIASTRDASPAKRELVSSHITAAVDRLRATTDELLSLVRLEASLPEQPRQPIPYAAFVEELLAEYRRDPRYADFTLRVEVGPEVGEVRLAREGWARLLRNLLDNALVQPMSRREVVVRAERTADGLVTSVRDFGPGISPGNREKIFRRFFTQRPEGAQPGTGLGLSIVQAVAQAHGGRVEVDAGASGGAIFRVIVPG